jgi:hypothetical protein
MRMQNANAMQKKVQCDAMSFNKKSKCECDAKKFFALPSLDKMPKKRLAVRSRDNTLMFSPCLTTWPFTRCQTPKILAGNVFFLVARFEILWGDFFFWASNWFRLCVKIIVIVHHVGNSAQMSFSSAHTKFPNWGRTSAFLTCANEHYAANLRGVN